MFPSRPTHGGGGYRGRIAPSPTGYLHMGHARTFWVAQQRAQERNGVLVLRNEDLDHARCRPEFVGAMMEDLRWFGFVWQEGPDVGGPCGPYAQSQRLSIYRAALAQLREAELIYPCTCSRKDIASALGAPHEGDEEPIYPGTCRNRTAAEAAHLTRPFNWRFRTPTGSAISFTDIHRGPQSFTAGRDFGDFVVWRQDDVPAYQLAVTVDDAAMRITEVVRGADLLVSTARQLLLYEALGFPPPAFYHCDLMLDERGVRLAKRHDSLSLHSLREQGRQPEELRHGW